MCELHAHYRNSASRAHIIVHAMACRPTCWLRSSHLSSRHNHLQKRPIARAEEGNAQVSLLQGNLETPSQMPPETFYRTQWRCYCSSLAALPREAIQHAHVHAMACRVSNLPHRLACPRVLSGFSPFADVLGTPLPCFTAQVTRFACLLQKWAWPARLTPWRSPVAAACGAGCGPEP